MSKKPEIVVVAEKRVINSEINMYSEELDFSSLTVTTVSYTHLTLPTTSRV